jgi:hypothetical protein
MRLMCLELLLLVLMHYCWYCTHATVNGLVRDYERYCLFMHSSAVSVLCEASLRTAEYRHCLHSYSAPLMSQRAAKLLTVDGV